MKPTELAELIRQTITSEVENRRCVTSYRDPIIGFVSAGDPGFSNLSQWVNFRHLMPGELLSGARSVVCFYLPFAPEIAIANQQGREQVAREWAVAYRDTNTLIGRITSRLIEVLDQYGVRAAAEPATGNFDRKELRSHWSHKSIAVLAGIGSFGLHQLVITDAGCTGRFGSIVIDADLPIDKPAQKERCEYYAFGTCLSCVFGCPIDALAEGEHIDRQACWELCLKNADAFLDIGPEVQCCGKCAVVGPCAFESAV